MYVEALSVCVFGSNMKRERVKDSTKPFGASFAFSSWCCFFSFFSQTWRFSPAPSIYLLFLANNKCLPEMALQDMKPPESYRSQIYCRYFAR